MSREARLSAAIQRALLERGAFVYKTVGGSLADAGVMDLLVCANGSMIGLETKTGKKKPTPLQAARLEALRQAGGTAAVVYSVDEALRVCGFSKEE